MANDDYRIYIDTSTTPHKGVEIDDLRQVLRRSEEYLGLLCSDQKWNAAGTELQPANKINPWALYKPVREPALGMITRGDFGSLGLGSESIQNSLPYATTINGFVALYTDGDTNHLWKTSRANGWRYHRPRGMSQNPIEPFRIFDFVKVVSENSQMHPVAFVGYNHRAGNPFGTFDCVTNVSKNGGSFWAMNAHGLIPSTGVSEEDITIEDINATIIGTAYKMLYYGVMLVPEDGQSGVTTTYLIFNNDHTINDGNTGSDYIRGNEDLALDTFLLSDTMPIGFYTAYPFLCGTPLESTRRYLTYTAEQRQQGVTLPARLYPLPGTTPLRVNIYNTTLIINVIPSGSVNNAYMGRMYLTIRNNGADAVTLPYLELQFRTSNVAYNTARRTGEVFYKIDGGAIFRIDDDHPLGVNTDAYEDLLTPDTPYPVPGNGGEIRIPDLSAQQPTIRIDFPGPQTPFVIVGDPTRTNVYGIAEFRMPAIPDAQLIEEQ